MESELVQPTESGLEQSKGLMMETSSACVLAEWMETQKVTQMLSDLRLDEPRVMLMVVSLVCLSAE